VRRVTRGVDIWTEDGVVGVVVVDVVVAVLSGLGVVVGAIVGWWGSESGCGY
jgi:hypothetical protein